MKFSLLSIGKLAMLLLVFTAAFTSCEKDNIDIIEEEVVAEVEIEDETSATMAITMNGTTTEVDAFASYCQGENGEIFLKVSNNIDLLPVELTLEEFQIDDFLIFYIFDEAGSEFSLGGAVFEDEVDGTPITSVILDSASEVVLDEATEDAVTGSMTGTFNLSNGDEVEYSVTFDAEVVQESTYCN